MSEATPASQAAATAEGAQREEEQRAKRLRKQKGQEEIHLVDTGGSDRE
jgi:hypothetical protein